MVEFSYPSIFEVLISKTILFYMKFNNLIFLEKFRLFTICLNIPGILKSFIYVGVPGFQSFIYSAFQFRCHTSHFLKGLFTILQCALCFLQKFRTFKILSVILHIFYSLTYVFFLIRFIMCLDLCSKGLDLCS